MKIFDDYKRYSKRNSVLDFYKVIFNLPFFAIFIFRLSTFLFKLNKLFFPFSKILLIISRIITGIEIELGAEIDGGFKIAHGVGVVIGSKSRIGRNVTIFQNVTLGGSFNKVRKFGEKELEHPSVDDGVFIGAGAKIIGPVYIGKNSIIGANSTVTSDVEENSIIIGNPGYLLKKRKDGDYNY